MASPPPTVNNKIPAHLSPEDDILEVIDGHIQGGVKGFYEKYFSSKSWSSACRGDCASGGPQWSLDGLSRASVAHGFLKGQGKQCTCLPQPLRKPVLSRDVLKSSLSNGFSYYERPTPFLSATFHHSFSYSSAL
jgi:hypothetical protein